MPSPQSNRVHPVEAEPATSPRRRESLPAESCRAASGCASWSDFFPGAERSAARCSPASVPSSGVRPATALPPEAHSFLGTSRRGAPGCFAPLQVAQSLIWTPPGCRGNFCVMSCRGRLQSYIRPCIAGRSLRALMEFAKNDLIYAARLEALATGQVCVLAVRPDLPSHIDVPQQPTSFSLPFFAVRFLRGAHAHVMSLVGLAVRQNGPGGSRHLARLGHGSHIGRSPPKDFLLPAGFGLCPVQDRARTMNQE